MINHLIFYQLYGFRPSDFWWSNQSPYFLLRCVYVIRVKGPLNRTLSHVWTEITINRNKTRALLECNQPPLLRIQQRVLNFYRGRKLVLTRMVIPLKCELFSISTLAGKKCVLGISFSSRQLWAFNCIVLCVFATHVDYIWLKLCWRNL